MLRHSWDISPREAAALQWELAERVRITPMAREVRTIAGVDCAFLDSGRAILAGAVLCDAESMAAIVTTTEIRPCRFPYVPGLLSFREAPAVIAAVEKLPAAPDLLLCDGQGRAHPRGLGLACHVGLWLDLPTIGVAKSRLCGTHRDPGPRRGARTQLRLDPHGAGGAVVGAVVRTRTNVKPLYVSCGHRVTLEDSVRWVLRCTRGVRLPEPVRLAHQHVTRSKALSGYDPKNWASRSRRPIPSVSGSS